MRHASRSKLYPQSPKARASAAAGSESSLLRPRRDLRLRRDRHKRHRFKVEQQIGVVDHIPRIPSICSLHLDSSHQSGLIIALTRFTSHINSGMRRPHDHGRRAVGGGPVHCDSEAEHGKVLPRAAACDLNACRLTLCSRAAASLLLAADMPYAIAR